MDFNIEKNNYKNLMEIKKIIVEYFKEDKNKKNNKYFNKFIKIDDEIHKAGLNKANAKELTNQEIIDFINYDIYYNDSRYENDTRLRDPNLFKYYDIHDKSTNKKFFEMKIWEKFIKNKKNFYNIFIEKIDKIKDLSYYMNYFQKINLIKIF